MELGLPSANRALTFVLGTVVAVAVDRAVVPALGRGAGQAGGAALHPGSLTAEGGKRRLLVETYPRTIFMAFWTKTHLSLNRKKTFLRVKW